MNTIQYTHHQNVSLHNLFEFYYFFSVWHNVKINRNLIESPSIQTNDLVYISGEIAYERFTSGAETISSPHIFAKKVHRLENMSDPADLEQLHKGKIEVFLLRSLTCDWLVERRLKWAKQTIPTLPLLSLPIVPFVIVLFCPFFVSHISTIDQKFTES